MYFQVAATTFASLASRIAQTAPVLSLPRMFIASPVVDLADPSLMYSVLASVQQQLESDPSVPLNAIQHPTDEIRSVRCTLQFKSS